MCYIAGDEEKMKDGKTRKSRSEEKVVGFSSTSLFLARKRKAVTHGAIRVIDYPTRKKTQGAGFVKGWEDKRDHGRISDTFTKNKNTTSAGPLTPQKFPLYTL